MPILAENVNLATRGQIGKKFIYWNIRGEQFRRPYVIPADPKTFNQRTQRNKFYVASQQWNKLTTEKKKEWEERVQRSKYKMSAYNYFMRKKIKEILKMIKKITHGSETLSDGANVILISEIQLDKTVLHYNCYAQATGKEGEEQSGIPDAYFSDSTHITAHCIDPTILGTVKLYYTIIEYV